MKKYLITTLLILLGTLAFSQERIAVFPFEDMDNLLTKNESVFFYRQFSNEFTNKNAGRFTIVPRQDVEKLFNAEEKFQLSDLSAKAKTAETQRVLNGTQILSGIIGKKGNVIRVSVSLYTFPELSQLKGGVDFDVANVDGLFDKIPELVQKMQNNIAAGEAITDVNKTASTGQVNLSTGQVRQETAVEYFHTKPIAGGVAITDYLGFEDELDIFIPARINGKQVLAIESSAFGGSKKGYSLTSVIIPEGVATIGDHAFCFNELTNVYIPASVTQIGDGAFHDNPLSTITVSEANNTYISIDGVVFSKDRKTLIAYPGSKGNIYIIPYGVISIEACAFYGAKMRRVIIPESVISIGREAFYGCRLEGNLTIPYGVTVIEALSFCGNNLTQVTIPKGVTIIGDDAFSCNQLQGVSIPDGVTSIGDRAFERNQLSFVFIPKSVTSIGAAAFSSIVMNPGLEEFHNKQLSTVIIGPNVKLNQYGSFSNGFDEFYNSNGKQSGRYNYNGSRWGYTP